MSFNYRYNPRPIAAASSIKLANGKVGGFACVTDGKISVVDGGGNPVITDYPVKLGNWYPLPFAFTPGDQAAFITDATASGTVGV